MRAVLIPIIRIHNSLFFKVNPLFLLLTHYLRVMAARFIVNLLNIISLNRLNITPLPFFLLPIQNISSKRLHSKSIRRPRHQISDNALMSLPLVDLPEHLIAPYLIANPIFKYILHFLGCTRSIRPCNLNTR